MIEANESYIVEKLKEAGVEAGKIRTLLRQFAGWRIYIRKKQNEYDEIRTLYNQMRRTGYTRDQAAERLAELFEKSVRRVKQIVREQGVLFE